MPGSPHSVEEATPLISDNEHTGPARQTHPQRTVALTSLLILFLAGAGSLCRVPETRLLEDVLCHRYYKDVFRGGDTIDERLCKADQVQSELAYILGASSTTDAVTGLVVALPYGVLADRIGRRFVLVLSTVGTIFSTLWMMVVLRFWEQIPVYFTVASPAFQVVGGGTSVLLAMAYSLVADAVPNAIRVDSFSRMAAASYVGTFLGSLSAARLMQTGSPWIPVLLSIVLVILGTSLVFFIPEALHAKHHGSQVTTTPTKQQSFLSSIRNHITKSLSRFKQSITVLHSPSAFFVLLVFLCQVPVILAAGQLFVQYVSKRFGWSLAETGYLLSIRGITSIFVLLVGLPQLGKFLTSSSTPPIYLSPQSKDLALARLSALCITTGALLMASNVIPIIAAGQVILTLGDGLIPLCRSIITSFVDAEHFSTVYTLISMTETVGAVGAGPTLAGLFSAGIKLGGPAIFLLRWRFTSAASHLTPSP
ncbi:hypothetical protein VPNG_02111 [Cytospora leucostoma]|uniref:Major facilitator superfamily (MFS) profile domain-containing protein n=1 Tax=Cytospora leucostoma TaxID=1230097 RepID=A0A423XHX1_9PEZI|nr:hypothetical protein VPNG_02111 [Cytospora leucostoma]